MEKRCIIYWYIYINVLYFRAVAKLSESPDHSHLLCICSALARVLVCVDWILLG